MLVKNSKTEKVVSNLKKFCNFREEVINFFRDYMEMLSDENYDARKNKTEGKGIKILTLNNASKITNSSRTSKSR